MTLFVVTGANGFIGRHLVASLVADGKRVRVLTRMNPRTEGAHDGVESVVGDISDRGTWEVLLEKRCIVINLAYSNTLATTTAVDATTEMIEACAQAGVAHLIHCSTASVYGRVGETIITEQSVCNPLDDYGLKKLQLENVLNDKVKGRFPVTIIRPSAVFGDGGEALIKLLNELTKRRRIVSYLRSSMFGQRNTHLVPVETVVAAFRFICDMPAPAVNEIFNVSDDDDGANNFRNVERILMIELKLPPYSIPRIPFPRFLLEVLLRIMGRANVNTQSVYSRDKLSSRGFVKPVTLKAALQKLAVTYKVPHGKNAP